MKYHMLLAWACCLGLLALGKAQFAHQDPAAVHGEIQGTITRPKREAAGTHPNLQTHTDLFERPKRYIGSVLVSNIRPKRSVLKEKGNTARLSRPNRDSFLQDLFEDAGIRPKLTERRVLEAWRTLHKLTGTKRAWGGIGFLEKEAKQGDRRRLSNNALKGDVVKKAFGGLPWIE